MCCVTNVPNLFSMGSIGAYSWLKVWIFKSFYWTRLLTLKFVIVVNLWLNGWLFLTELLMTGAVSIYVKYIFHETITRHSVINYRENWYTLSAQQMFNRMFGLQITIKRQLKRRSMHVQEILSFRSDSTALFFI